MKNSFDFEENRALFVLLAAVAVIIFAAYGYIANIIYLVGADFSNITGELFIRCCGVIVPFIGSFCGLFLS